MNKKILGLALATAFTAGTAQAATVTEGFVVGMQTTDLTSVTGSTGSIAIGSFNQFDATLGNLTSVDISITGESTSTTSLTSNAANTQNFSFDSSLQWAFEVVDGDDALDFDFVHGLSSTGGFVSLTSGSLLDLGTVTASDTYSTSVSGADLTAFIGSGTAGIGCNTFSSSTFTGTTNIKAVQATEAGCEANIVYNYEAASVSVPEPASIALLGLGLGFMGFARRNKKS